MQSAAVYSAVDQHIAVRARCVSCEVDDAVGLAVSVDGGQKLWTNPGSASESWVLSEAYSEEAVICETYEELRRRHS